MMMTTAPVTAREMIAPETLERTSLGFSTART